MIQRARQSDLLDEHAQALLDGDDARRQRARLLAQGDPDVLAMMDVAEQVRGALHTAHPRPEFRERLKVELVQRSWRRHHYRGLLYRGLRSYWLWGALASLLSVAGGVGYYLHRRSQAA